MNYRDMDLPYRDECFLCGRKGMTLAVGHYAPNTFFHDVPVMICTECSGRMITEQETFFETLNTRELDHKYFRVREEIIRQSMKKGQDDGTEQRDCIRPDDGGTEGTI